MDPGNGGKFPKIVTEDSKYNFIGGAARKDPAFAFGLLDIMEFEDQENAMHRILESGDMTIPDSVIWCWERCAGI